MYRLEVSQYAGPLAWRFQLLDATGDAVAEHRVELKSAPWEFEAFTELYGYLRRYAVPDRRLASEQQLVTALGDWITKPGAGCGGRRTRGNTSTRATDLTGLTLS